MRKPFSKEGKTDQNDATYKLFETLYDDYLKRLGDTWDATNKRILDAQKKFDDAGRTNFESAEAAQKARHEAQRDYVDAVREAWEASQKDYTAAYDDYLSGFRDAWGTSDLKNLSPATMSILTHSGSVAAGYAASTIGNWQLISWAGVPPWVLSSDQPAADTAVK